MQLQGRPQRADRLINARAPVFITRRPWSATNQAIVQIRVFGA
jgi:hypothetical protein